MKKKMEIIEVSIGTLSSVSHILDLSLLVLLYILGFELVPTAFPTGPTGPGDPVGPTWPCREGRNTTGLYIYRVDQYCL